MTYSVVGLGAPDRGDDAIGLVVAEQLAERGVRAVQVKAPLDLLDLFDGHDTVFVVDATRSGTPPGTRKCQRATRIARSAESRISLSICCSKVASAGPTRA